MSCGERNERGESYSILTPACEDATGWPRLPPARTCSDGTGPPPLGSPSGTAGDALFPPRAHFLGALVYCASLASRATESPSASTIYRFRGGLENGEGLAAPHGPGVPKH